MRNRVLHLCPFMQHGGTERHLLNLALGLSDEFEVFISAPPGPMAPVFAEKVGHLIDYPAPMGFRLSQINDIIASIGGHLSVLKPDLIHIHASREMVWATRRAIKTLRISCPIVFTPHIYVGIGDRLSTSMFSRLADKVIAVSDAERARLVRFLPSSIRDERVVCVHNGTPLADQDRMPVADQGNGIGAASVPKLMDAVASSPGVDRHGSRDTTANRVIGTVGRLSKEKGTVYLLRAFKTLSTEFPHARLAVIGGGGLGEYLQREAQSLGVTDRVTFAGVMDDPSSEVSRFDIFVSPSLNETLSMSIIEAMALRKPVVATRVGATHEAVIHGETGLLCRPGKPDELANSIRTLLLWPDMGRRMGEAGRQRAVSLFSAQRMVDKTIAVYRRLLLERR